MNWLDYCILIYLFFQAISGVKMGFSATVRQLFAWIFGLFLILNYSQVIGEKLPLHSILISEGLRTVVGGLVLLGVTSLSVSFFAGLMPKLLPSTESKIMKNIAGLGAGALKGSIIISVVVFFLQNLIDLPSLDAYNNSELMAVFQAFQPATEFLVQIIKGSPK